MSKTLYRLSRYAALLLCAGLAVAQEPRAPEARDPASTTVQRTEAEMEVAEDATQAEDLAFISAIAGIPGAELQPGKITELKQTARSRMREEVSNDPPAGAVSTVVSAGFGPAAAAPQIVLYHGYVTAIDVVDSTGQPWPAYSPTIGDELAVKVIGEMADAKTDSPTVLVQPVGRYANTNLILPLRGAPRPIAVLLRNDDPGPKAVVHDRVTIIVEGRGPNAAPVVAERFGGPEDDLRAVLLGEQPTTKAVLAHVDLDRSLAWREGNQLWLRTTAELISPAPTATLQLGELRAYRTTSLPSVVIADASGELRTVRVAETAEIVP